MNKLSLLLSSIALSLTLVSCDEWPFASEDKPETEIEPETDTATVGNTVASDYDNRIFALINKHRTDNNLKALIFDETIWRYANEHSVNMATGVTTFSHDGFSDRTAAIRNEIGGGNAGENIAYNSSSDPQSVVSQWLRSEGHRDNIEKDYTHSALSAIKGTDGKYYYTQIFIRIDD